MIRNIQALRFVFCMLIFMCHFTGMLHLQPVFVYGGDAGVAFFFMLSGFVLSVGCGAKVESGQLQLGSFMWHRLIKLYPLHLVAMLVIVAFSVYSGQHFKPVAFLAQLLMFQAWVPLPQILNYGNGVSWFLGPLFLCYALFPWLYRGIMMHASRCFKCFVVVYFIIYPCLRFCNDSLIDDSLYAFPPLRVIDFMLGIKLHGFFRSDMAVRFSVRIRKMSVSLVTAIELSVVALCIGTYVAYPHLPSWVRFSALFWIPFYLTILCFALLDNGRGYISRLLHMPVVQWLGSISFEMYMLHIIAITVVVSVYGKLFGYDNMKVLPLLSFSFVVTVLVSIIAKRTERFIRKG